MDSPYQIRNQSPPFNDKTSTTDSKSSSISMFLRCYSMNEHCGGLSSSSMSLSSPSFTTSLTTQSCGHAFQPYRCMLSAVMENGVEKTALSQNMMKKAHSMLRNINLFKEQRKTEELKLLVYQNQHMASERRRRERLNVGYHSLWKLLPPGSKKDKTSVLCKAMSCITTLKTEVCELEEKNRIIEEHLCSSIAVAKEHRYIFSGERVNVQIFNQFKEPSEMELIDLVVTVMVQCDLMRVVLRVLECIREMQDVSLLRLEASPAYCHERSMHATLKLAIQGSTWNERNFKELITGAALMALNH